MNNLSNAMRNHISSKLNTKTRICHITERIKISSSFPSFGTPTWNYSSGKVMLEVKNAFHL